MKLQKYYRSNKMNLSEYYSKLEMCRLKCQKLDQGSANFPKIQKKVKCTHVQALRLCTGCMAHSGSRGIALPFLDHGTSRGWGGQHHAPATLYPQERPGTHCTGGCVGPRASLDRCGKSHPHQDSIPRPSSP
jgi:hypothetical protein